MSMGRQSVRTAEARKTFLRTLSEACNVTQACRAAKIGRNTVYTWRDEDEAFAKEWDEAIDEGIDQLEAEAWRRGVKGVERPVTYQGKITDTFTEHSDRMLELLLKAHRPEKYVERIRSENTHAVTVNIQGPAADL